MKSLRFSLFLVIVSSKEITVRILRLLTENTGLSSLSAEQKSCVLGACSIYLPFPLTICVIVAMLYRYRNVVSLRVLFEETPGIRWILLFWAISVLSSVLWQNWLGFANALGIILIFVFIMMYRHFLDRKMLECTIFWWVLLSIPAGLFGIIQYLYYSIQAGTIMVQDNPDMRVSSVFFHTNLYATLLVMVILLCMYCFICYKSREDRMFLLCTASFNFFMLLLTGCRSALVPFALVVPVFFWADNKQKLLRITLLAEAIAAISILFIPDLIPRLDDVSTLYSRMRIWQATLDYLPQCFWFGMGPQAFALLGDATQLYAPHAHNILLDSLLCYGITGTICIVGFVLTQLIRLFRMHKSHGDRALFSLVLCLYIAAVIQGVIDVTLDFPATGLMFLLLICSPPPWPSQAAPDEKEQGSHRLPVFPIDL